MSSAGAVAQSVVTKFAIIGINAATGIITARALLPVGRGELAAMILWPVFLANTLTLGFPSALTFEMKSNPKKSSELLGTALLLAVLTSAIAIALGVLFMHSWIPQYSLKAILYAQILLATTPLTSLLNVGRGAFLARGDFGVVNGLLACSPALTLSLLIALLLTHSLTPYSGALAYAPVGVVPVGWMMWRLWRLFRPSLKSFRSSARSLFSYGIRSYGVDLCGTMALYVDQVVVVRFLMPDMMGIYVVALSLSRMLNVFHTSVVMVLFPKAVSESAETVRAMTGRAMRMSTLLTASTGLGIALVGAPLLGLLYGHEYRSAASVLRILVMEVVLAGATLVLGQAFMALGRPGVVTALQVTGLLLVVPLMLVLVPRYGIVGAGIALLLSTTTRFLFVLASFRLFLKIPAPALLPNRDDLRYIARAVSQRISFLEWKTLAAAKEMES
ncbi:MAG: oligosaccharide flippase family protein [Candidatus Acidiferrales bacterium]